MRTTLALDDDVLSAARALAHRQKRSLGDVLSELARRGLTPPAPQGQTVRNGIPLLPIKGSTPVSLELVNRLRDEVA